VAAPRIDDFVNSPDRTCGNTRTDADIRIDVVAFAVRMKQWTGQCSTQSAKRQRRQLSVTTCGILLTYLLDPRLCARGRPLAGRRVTRKDQILSTLDEVIRILGVAWRRRRINRRVAAARPRVASSESFRSHLLRGKRGRIELIYRVLGFPAAGSVASSNVDARNFLAAVQLVAAIILLN
jgi:hypothetical protein